MYRKSANTPLQQQLLFNPVSDDRLYLAMQQLKFAAAIQSANTRKAYRWDWQHFEAWCDSRGLCALPATEETVALYVTHLFAEKNAKVASVRRYVAAIRHRHKSKSCLDPVTSLVRQLIVGAQRERHDIGKGKNALTVEQVIEICRLLSQQRGKRAIRSRTLILFGFATALRRSEICALDLADIEFRSGGIQVTIQQSKESLEPEIIALRSGSREATCPVRAMHEWLRVRGKNPGPLFVCVKGEVLVWKRMVGETINRTVKEAVASIGLDPALYGAHSLRAGYVTSAHLNGASDLAIAAQTRHSLLSSVRRYIRNADPFKGKDPINGLL